MFAGVIKWHNLGNECSFESTEVFEVWVFINKTLED